jgi:hypothetical protein
LLHFVDVLVFFGAVCNSSECFRIRVILRLAVYRQSVRLGAKPLEAHGQRFYFFETETLWS